MTPVATSEVRSELEKTRPVAEILVEGELSPFEHEALYRLLKRHFLVKQPVYSESPGEIIGTRVNIFFHHSYDQSFFAMILQKDWGELRDLFKQISYRRGRLGASFTLGFIDEKTRLFFSTGVLSEPELGAAMDHLSYLPGIIGQMLVPERMPEPLGQIEASFDKTDHRWQDYRGFVLQDRKEYVFDENVFRWKSR